MRGIVIVLLAVTLLGCAAKGQQAGSEGEIFDQFTRADFAGIDSRRGFVDYIYLHMAEMEGVDDKTRLCLGRQYEGHMTPRYWQAVDQFLADHSAQHWEDVVHVHNVERSPYSAEAADADVKACL